MRSIKSSAFQFFFVIINELWKKEKSKYIVIVCCLFKLLMTYVMQETIFSCKPYFSSIFDLFSFKHDSLEYLTLFMILSMKYFDHQSYNNRKRKPFNLDKQKQSATHNIARRSINPIVINWLKTMGRKRRYRIERK